MSWSWSWSLFWDFRLLVLISGINLVLISILGLWSPSLDLGLDLGRQSCRGFDFGRQSCSWSLSCDSSLGRGFGLYFGRRYWALSCFVLVLCSVGLNFNLRSLVIVMLLIKQFLYPANYYYKTKPFKTNTCTLCLNKQSVYALLQAVFVVCVNLQGLFIFFFHCVRNTTVRSEWKSVLSRIQTYTSSTSNMEGPGSSRSINPLQPPDCETAELHSHENDTRLWKLNRSQLFTPFAVTNSPTLILLRKNYYGWTQ